MKVQLVKGLVWKNSGSIPPLPKWKSNLSRATDVKPPIEYFSGLLSKACFESMVEQSNLFACLKKPVSFT